MGEDWRFKVELTSDEIRDWFLKHIAKFSTYRNEQDERIEFLFWTRPDSSIYRIRYMIYHNLLFVSGDVGEAIYRWSSEISFSWLAGLDYSYFSGKCQASEVGRDYISWDQDKAVKNLKDYLREQIIDEIDTGEIEDNLISALEEELKKDGFNDQADKECEKYDEEYLIRYKSKDFENKFKEAVKIEEDKLIDLKWKEFKELDGAQSINEKQGWSFWCNEHGYDFFGDSDWWEWAPNIGEVINSRCKSHLLGIKMAIERKEKEETKCQNT